MILTFQNYITKIGLGGKSRSGGKANWDYYVVDTNAWKTETFEMNMADILVDANGKEVLKLNKDQKIRIISPITKKIGVSFFAEIEVGKQKGYVKINSIKKPRKSKNTKTFTPNQLNLVGKTFNLDGLVNAVVSSIKRQPISEELKNYLFDAVSAITSKTLFEAADRFTKDIKLSMEHSLDAKSELNLISKNFGEVLSALFILTTNKKIQTIEFPVEENYPLCDFIAIDGRGSRTFYSVKSGRGSSTDINNIKVFLPYLKVNKSSLEYKVLDIILAQLKLSKSGKEVKEKNSTINAIMRYWSLPDNVSTWINFCNHMNKGEKTPIANTQLDVDSINQLWMAIVQSTERFNKLLEGLTKFFDYQINNKTKGTLEQIFSATQKSDISRGGFLLYPMGSSLIKRLNANPDMVELLNQIVTLSSKSGMVSQITLDAYKDKLVVQIIKFKNIRFKFSYNGMMKAPSNRPLGFKEQ